MSIGFPSSPLPCHKVTMPARLALLLLAATVSALEMHVAPGGDDAGPGTAERPLATLASARDRARASGKLGKEPVQVTLADGAYFLPETFVLTTADSGTAEHPVTYRAAHEGKAVISGGIPLKPDWKPWRDGIFVAETPPALAIDQLFVDGTRQILARYPNYNPELRSTPYRGAAADAFAPSRAARWKDPTGGFIHVMHAAHWGGYHYRITGKDAATNQVSHEGGWQNNRGGPMHPKDRMVEGILEELDAPGEWFHDAKAGRLYLKPAPGMDLARVEVVGVRLAGLVALRGTPEAPIRGIRLEGLVFRHAARTFMETREPLLRSDWTFHRGAAVLITGAEDCAVTDSEVDQPGGNAVLVSGYARRVALRGLHIHDTGATGIAFVGETKAVRNPLLHYDQRLKVAQLDRTPGPRSPDYPSDCLAEDCLVERIGQLEKQGAGVLIEMASRITLRHLTIHETSRAGINIGDGCWGGHLIEGCDIFDTVLETSDHGSFNSWGRDRYWGATSPEDIAREPALPFLDAVEPIEIRFSRWRCDHGWDIDLDDGSSNYRIHHNLFLAGGLKFREGYGRSAWNNVFVNCGFHPHVWYPSSGDTLERNILLRAHAPIGMPKAWGKSVDRNLFANPNDLAAARRQGVDAQSIAADPGFVDPAQGDFTLKSDSPALALGIESLGAVDYGVRKPSLRALAPRPVIDAPRPAVSALAAALSAPAAAKAAGVAPSWRGIDVSDLVGEGYSAYGVDKETRGAVLDTPPAGHPLAARLSRNTLVLAVNGQPINGAADLMDLSRGPMRSLDVIRDQKRVTLSQLDAPTPAKVAFADTPEALPVRPGQLPSLKARWTANPKPANGPADELGDGRLVADYGPVFGNGIQGRYLADLGAVRSVSSLRVWSYRQSPTRLPQRLTVLGSAADKAPAALSDYTYLGEIDTTAEKRGAWHQSTLRLTGKARWILILPESPVNGLENTVYQEIEIGG